MQVDQWVDQLIAAVRRRLTSQQLREAEIRAEVAPGYLRKAHGSTRNIMLAKFLRICEGAHLDPTEIFAEVFPTDQPTPKYGVPIPQRPVPNIVKRVRALVAEEEKETTEPLPRHWLEWLDELRYDKPERALQLLESTFDYVQKEDLALALGIWASTCRVLTRYEEAFLACLEAENLARQQGSPLAKADLLQRMSFLVMSMAANYSAALALSEQAALLRSRHGDLNGLGRVLVDQGTIHYYLSRYQESVDSFRAGLRFLDEGEVRNRMAAFHGLGVVRQAQGLPHQALKHFQDARKLVRSGLERGKLDWLEGCTRADLEEWEFAFQSFLQAWDGLICTSPVDAALCACDHVAALLKAGRPDEAKVRSQEVQKLFEPLRGNLIASAALLDLVRCEQEGEQLTSTFLFRIKQRLEKSRRASARRES